MHRTLPKKTLSFHVGLSILKEIKSKNKNQEMKIESIQTNNGNTIKGLEDEDKYLLRRQRCAR